jgi:DNA-binding transcriptional regulator YbjK
MRFVAPQVTLDDRIKNVENALTSIRDLETYLNKIKQDMVATETATQQLNEKYVKAKELEKLTQVQIDALKATLQTESWHRTLFTSAMGFILGIASSFVASVLYTKWGQREALK